MGELKLGGVDHKVVVIDEVDVDHTVDVSAGGIAVGSGAYASLYLLQRTE